MSMIPVKRSIFGWKLAIVVLAWSYVLILTARGHVLEDSPILLIGLGTASVALGWLYFGHHTAMIVGDGHLTVPSWFGSITIPVAVIQRARVVRIHADTFLEVCLHEVPDTLQPYLNTLTKRRMLGVLKHIGYIPPPEPYLFIAVMQPDCDDASLMNIINIERQALFQHSTKTQASPL